MKRKKSVPPALQRQRDGLFSPIYLAMRYRYSSGNSFDSTAFSNPNPSNPTFPSSQSERYRDVMYSSNRSIIATNLSSSYDATSGEEMTHGKSCFQNSPREKSMAMPSSSMNSES